MPGEVTVSAASSASSAVTLPVTAMRSPFRRSPDTSSTAGTATACPSGTVPRSQTRSCPAIRESLSEHRGGTPAQLVPAGAVRVKRSCVLGPPVEFTVTR